MRIDNLHPIDAIILKGHRKEHNKCWRVLKLGSQLGKGFLIIQRSSEVALQRTLNGRSQSVTWQDLTEVSWCNFIKVFWRWSFKFILTNTVKIVLQMSSDIDISKISWRNELTQWSSVALILQRCLTPSIKALLKEHRKRIITKTVSRNGLLTELS